MIPLSLASKQIWPQVLSVLHVGHRRLILYHSDEEAESKRPAERPKDQRAEVFADAGEDRRASPVILRPILEDSGQFRLGLLVPKPLPELSRAAIQ